MLTALIRLTTRRKSLAIARLPACARVILGGIEMIHMMRKQQAKYACCLRSHHLRSSSICSPHELITLHMPFSGSYS
jgi:hypothetical protein